MPFTTSGEARLYTDAKGFLTIIMSNEQQVVLLSNMAVPPLQNIAFSKGKRGIGAL